ncbi:Gfo/Idh/MocA family protein [Pseudorhodoferax sp. Leaf267]|uniref:Gfo/Idh/MocA family protein n=1 Tax=Pseudorhodoferax sp. Leaf267 TaxID=1736316 RepID=UPI0006FC407A|nr:Gfo/Idh/MocA family oxidoreductase [Pseudorhodoferax sp. Leaf267]KQP22072.1 oxidoreductase [Pseudorhodoferax sp. Leaf267]
MHQQHNQRLRVAVIGAGVASPPHFKSLHDLRDEVEVAWVWGRDAQRVAAAGLPVGATVTTRLDDVLADASVQAALVLTPPQTHLHIVEQLAAAGKHVLVEKPLELTLAQSEQLVATCERHGVQLAVMLQHRASPAALHLSSMLQAGELGELLSASASIRWWRPQSYYDQPGRGTLARDGGGVLMTQAIHTLDLLLHLAGAPARVTGLVGTRLHRMETEDTAGALLQWADGAVGVVDATTAAYPGYPERIALNFARGTATLEAGALRVERPGAEPLLVGQPQASGSGANLMGFDHAGHRAVLQDFVQAIAQQRAPLTAGRSALAAHRLIDAIVRSSRTGAAVTL